MTTKLKKLAGKIFDSGWSKRFYEKSRFGRATLFGGVLFAAFILIGTYFFPSDKTTQYAEYQIGTVAPDPIISPATFAINKPAQEYDHEKEEARKNILPRFYRDTDAENEAARNLVVFFNYLQTFRDVDSEFRRLSSLNSRSAQGKADSLLLRQLDEQHARAQSIVDLLKREYNIDIQKPNWAFILGMNDSSFDRFRRTCSQILSDLYSIGLLNVSKTQSQFENTPLTLRDISGENTRQITEFFDKNDSFGEISSRLELSYTPLSDTISVGLETIQNFLIPNIKYDAEMTDRLRSEAAARVPRARGYVLEKEKIIDRNERITEEHFRKIESLREYLKREGVLQSSFSLALLYLGQMGYIAVVLLLFTIYLYQFRPGIIKDSKKLTIIFLILITQILFVHLVVRQFGLSEYLIPTTIASMLLAIIFDGGVGFYGTLLVGLLVGGYLGNDFNITIYVLVGGAAAILSVRRIRHLSQFFKAILIIFLGYAIVFTIIGILRGMTFADIAWVLIKFSLPNAILSPLITLGFLALFEMLFGVTTDMTLLELSDLNSPLLRELAIRAPGTYHHSIVLGNLSERAAEAVGANSLLARVGCYYHDIGKMVKPQYFIENEPDASKKHEALAPSMSSLIISSHVREGLEIAEKYKLPEVIKDFITQHHGTSRISFFYEKALQKSKAKNLNPADFSYPGPKPQTKEAGIVMLADGVEAATRALKDPSSTRIRERVESIISSRFQEGQLDECEVTLRDLRQITESFIQILNGIFHKRIEYSEQDGGQHPAVKEKSAEK